MVKRFVLAALLIYSFNVIAVSLNLVIPINLVTVFLVSLFDIPGLVGLILLYCAVR